MKASGLARGSILLFNGEPMEVQEREFVKPGKGGAFVRLRLKSCIDGAVRRETLASEATVEEALVETRAMQYLYSDGEHYVCMDMESYEQFEVPMGALGERGRLLQEGKEYSLVRWNEKIIGIEMAPKMAFEVLVAEEASRGNTVSGVTKSVEIQNGIAINVPLFIKRGDTIIINTETMEYVERGR